MATVDTSMYPKAEPPPNLLDFVGKLQSTQAAINQNKLFPGQMQQQQLGISQGQLTNQGLQQDLRTKQVQAANTYLGSVFASNKNATPGDAYKAIVAGTKAGLIPDELAQVYLNEIPKDPNEFKNWQGAIVAQGVSPESRGNLRFGTMGTIDTGQEIQPIVTSPTMGVSQVGQPFRKQLSPETLAGNVEVFNPETGATEVITKEEQLKRSGQGSGGSQGGLGSGRKPTGGAGLQTSPALGQAESTSVTAQKSAGLGADLTALADQAITNKSNYANMAKEIKNFTSGPTADWTRAAASLANRYTPEFLQKAGVNIRDAKSVASQEEFNKIAQKIVAAQGSQSGMHLDVAAGANPSVGMSNLGIEKVLGMLQGSEDAVIAKNEAWQDYVNQRGGRTDGYGDFSKTFNKNFDPRIFQANYMPAADRASMLKGMSAGDKKDFLAKLRYAQSQGWIK